MFLSVRLTCRGVTRAGCPDGAPPPESKAEPSHTNAAHMINIPTTSMLRKAEPKNLAAPNTTHPTIKSMPAERGKTPARIVATPNIINPTRNARPLSGISTLRLSRWSPNNRTPATMLARPPPILTRFDEDTNDSSSPFNVLYARSQLGHRERCVAPFWLMGHCVILAE